MNNASSDQVINYAKETNMNNASGDQAINYTEETNMNNASGDQAINYVEEANMNNASAESEVTINIPATIRKRRLSRAPGVSYVEEEIDTSSSDSDYSADDAEYAVNNNTASIRKRRRSRAPDVSYVEEEIDTSSSDSDYCPDNCGDDDKSTRNTDIRLQEPGNSNNTNHPKKANGSKNAEPRRQRKRSPSKTEDRESSSSSDSSLDSDIKNTVNMFLKLSKTLIKHLTNIKGKIDQKKILYQCSKCSLHFHKKSKLLKHLKRRKDGVCILLMQRLQCEYCKLQFTKRSLQKHVKMHMKKGRSNNSIHFKILTENDCSFDDSGNTRSSSSKNSESNNDAQINVSISEPENSNKTVTETSMTEEENVNNVVTINNLQKNIKKKKNLYKCDVCLDHFINREFAYLHSHFENEKSTYQIGQQTICNLCTFKFSSPETLSQHERLHHIKLNLSKDDFRVVIVNKCIIDLIRCKGCDECVYIFSETTFLEHLCEGKTSGKYLCPSCQLYFLTKETFAQHQRCHKLYPMVRKENFRITSRKPRKHRNTSARHSHMVCATEENVNDSLTEQDNSKSINESENDLFTKSTEKCHVVSNDEECVQTSSSMNRETVSVEQNLNDDINITDCPDSVDENDVSINSTQNFSLGSNAISTETTNNANFTNNQDLIAVGETNVGRIFEKNDIMVVVESASFEKPHHEKTTEQNPDKIIKREIIRKEHYTDSGNPRAINSNRDNCQNENHQCDPNENPRIKIESLKEIKSEDNFISETRNNISNSSTIQIADSFSTKFKFEECDSSLNNADTNITNGINMTTNKYDEQKFSNDCDNSIYNSDDSQQTLMLEDYYDQKDKQLDNHYDDKLNCSSEESQSIKNEVKNMTTSIKEEPVVEDQKQNRKLINGGQQVESQKVIEISDSDDDDKDLRERGEDKNKVDDCDDAVVLIHENVETVDLTGS